MRRETPIHLFTKICCKSERYIYRLLDSGQLETFKIGRIWYFEKGHIESQREKYAFVEPPKPLERKPALLLPNNHIVCRLLSNGSVVGRMMRED
jgi:hypothetical protein